MNSPTLKRTKSGGDLLTLQGISEKAGVSESTVKRIIQGGHIKPIKIGRYSFMYYRDFLRAYWEYECSKERQGRKPANAKWDD